jgi:hypothetical protein
MNRKNQQERKELLSSLRAKNVVCRGRIRLLEFFRKQQYMRKQPFGKRSDSKIESLLFFVPKKFL